MFPDNLKQYALERNPLLIMGLGLCPAAAATTGVMTAFFLGAALTITLILTNFLTSMTRKLFSRKSRLPLYLIYSTLSVTLVMVAAEIYLPQIAFSVGLFLPLTAVNCLILERSESFASQNNPFPAIIDGLLMGTSYTGALIAIGALREILGPHTLLGVHLLPDAVLPIGLFSTAPGGFFALAIVMAVVTLIRLRKKQATVLSEKEATLIKVMQKR